MKQPKSNKNFTPLENFKKQPSESFSVMDSTYNGMLQSGMQGSCKENIAEITFDEKKILRRLSEELDVKKLASTKNLNTDLTFQTKKEACKQYFDSSVSSPGKKSILKVSTYKKSQHLTSSQPKISIDVNPKIIVVQSYKDFNKETTTTCKCDIF